MRVQRSHAPVGTTDTIEGHVSVSDVDCMVTPTQGIVEPNDTVSVEMLVNLDPSFSFLFDFFTDDQCDAGWFRAGFDVRYELYVNNVQRVSGTDCMTSHEEQYEATIQAPESEGTYDLQLQVIGNETDRLLASDTTTLEVQEDAPDDTPPNGDDGVWDDILEIVEQIPTTGWIAGAALLAVAILL